MVDVLEASRSFDKRVRIAVRVDDLHEAATAVTDAGGGDRGPGRHPVGRSEPRLHDPRRSPADGLFETG